MLTVVMGGMSWRGGSWEVTKPMVITWFKMEDVYIFCDMIKTLWRRKMTKVERWKAFVPFKLQMALAYLCKQPNTLITKERNWSMGCRLW